MCDEMNLFEWFFLLAQLNWKKTWPHLVSSSQMSIIWHSNNSTIQHLVYTVYIKALLWPTVSKTNYCTRKGAPVSKWIISFLSRSPGLPLRLTMQFRRPTHAKLRQRLTRSMLQLNANNHSLTCTSEYKRHLVCIHTSVFTYLCLTQICGPHQHLHGQWACG